MDMAQSNKEKELKANEKNSMNDVAQSAMGNFGKWQLLICLSVSVVKFPIAWNQLGIVFLAAKTDFHCSGSNQQCLNNASEPCTSWVYDRSVFRNTIISEWDLVCSKTQLQNLAQVITMVGIFVGNLVFSMASDKYGRKIPFIVATQLQMVTGIISAFSPWFTLFLLLRFLQSVATGGCITISFVLCMEILNGRSRAIIATLTHIPYNIGHVAMVGIAYYTRDWRYFQLATSLPSICLLLYWWLIPESPRWLMAVGKNEEAIKILQVAAKTNKNPIPEKIKVITNENCKMEKTQENKAGILDLIRTPNMRKKTLAMSFNWLCCGLCFYGLAQYAGQINGNIFMNVAISGSVVIPGMILSIYMMDKFGRKPSLITGQVIAAVSCFSILIFPKGSELSDTATVVLASLGNLGTGLAFCTVYVYSGELFPTVVRNIGLGSGSMSARIGSTIAPFVASLNNYNYYMSPLIFGLLPALSAIVTLLLPETLNCDLPQTLEDGEQFVKKSKKGVLRSNGSTNPGFQSDNLE